VREPDEEEKSFVYPSRAALSDADFRPRNPLQ
jgi:hypothetical protein